MPRPHMCITSLRDFFSRPRRRRCRIEQLMQKFLACLVCLFLGASLAAEAVDLAAILDLLGKRIDERAARASLVLLNQGVKPVAHINGNAFVGESRSYFFPANGIIVHSADYSGAGQRIGLVTLI